MKKKKILITYFKPLRKKQSNASREIGELLAMKLFPRFDVYPLYLEVHKNNGYLLEKSKQELIDALENEKYDYILAMGETLSLRKTCSIEGIPKNYKMTLLNGLLQNPYFKRNTTPRIGAHSQVSSILKQHEHKNEYIWSFLQVPRRLMSHKEIIASSLEQYLKANYV